MLSRRKMPDEKDVLRPGKGLRILGAADKEALIGAATGRFDEEGRQSALAVFGLGAALGEIRPVMGSRCSRPMNRRIGPAVKRRRAARPPEGAQPGQRRPTRTQ